MQYFVIYMHLFNKIYKCFFFEQQLSSSATMRSLAKQRCCTREDSPCHQRYKLSVGFKKTDPIIRTLHCLIHLHFSMYSNSVGSGIFLFSTSYFIKVHSMCGFQKSVILPLNLLLLLPSPLLCQYYTYQWCQGALALGTDVFGIFQYQANQGTNTFAQVQPSLRVYPATCSTA